MQKKISVQDLDIPEDDIDCWERYPKHRWVYDLSRILDAQHISWSPYKTSSTPTMISNYELKTSKNIAYSTSYIFINSMKGARIISELYLNKGEIKFVRYADRYLQEIYEVSGDIEIRINAFIALHFQKYTGVVSIETIGTEIQRVYLRPIIDLESNPEILKSLKKVYRNTTEVTCKQDTTSLV